MSDAIKSPCNSICKMENNICIGCHRTLEELIEWAMATDERKFEILQEIKNRKILK